MAGEKPSRIAVRRPRSRAWAVPAAGGDGRGGADHPRGGGGGVEGRDREGGACVGGDRGRAELGEGGEAVACGAAGREAVRDGRVYGVPYVSRGRLVEPRGARPDGDRHAQSRDQLPDPAPAVPAVR